MDKYEQLDIGAAFLIISRDKKIIRDKIVSGEPILLDLHDSVVIDCICTIYEDELNIEDYLKGIYFNKEKYAKLIYELEVLNSDSEQETDFIVEASLQADLNMYDDHEFSRLYGIKESLRKRFDDIEKNNYSPEYYVEYASAFHKLCNKKQKTYRK